MSAHLIFLSQLFEYASRAVDASTATRVSKSAVIHMFRWLLSAIGSGGRSGSWARVRREHLKRSPTCIACGRSRDLEVHHVVPFHSDATRELDPDNLVTLCGDPCHFVHGHFMSWTRINPDVRSDCSRYFAAKAKQTFGDQ